MSEPMGTRAASTSQDTSTAALSQAAALASACSGCHRQGGQTIVDLHALTAQQLEQSLLGYKRAVDGPSVMHRMARGYSDGEIAAIAQLLGR